MRAMIAHTHAHTSNNLTARRCCQAVQHPVYFVTASKRICYPLRTVDSIAVASCTPLPTQNNHGAGDLNGAAGDPVGDHAEAGAGVADAAPYGACCQR